MTEQKERYIEVFGDERQELLANQDDLGTPKLSGSREHGYHAKADEMRAWRKLRGTDQSEPLR